MEGPIRLEVRFLMPRPQAHYHWKQRMGQRVQGELRDDAPLEHVSQPDTTKLLRALEDALTGVIWLDDKQVWDQRCLKFYDCTPGAHVIIKGAVS